MKSEAYATGWCRFPEFKGTRVMMMPYQIEDPHGSLPDYLQDYAHMLSCSVPVIDRGVGYLTIDEALVPAGTTHRRPGLHVDGGSYGGWGGGGGGWAGTGGMYLAASVTASMGWVGDFQAVIGPDGEVDQLDLQTHRLDPIALVKGTVYHCNSHFLHQALPLAQTVQRQFVRVSTPSDAPWYEGYTENPLGIRPTGPVLPSRSAQMGYRP